jgi:hypothetical protein
MKRPSLAALIAWSLAATLNCGAASRADEYQAGSPFTYCFDSGTPAAEPLTPQALAAKSGWTLLPEDETERKFRGDAVLMNDRIAIVFRAKGDAAEIYRLAAGGWKRRAEVRPTLAEPVGFTLEGSRLAQNSRSIVSLSAVYAGRGGERAAVEFSLATSQVTVEVKPGDAVEQMSVCSAARYVVVPDFFGDDAVLGPKALGEQPVGLPAENFFLNLLEGHDAMLMCVWQSDRPRDATARRMSATRTDCRIGCAKGKSLWVAALEEADLWHEREAEAASQGAEIGLDWTRPFAAKWRADFTRPDGFAASWYFTGSGDEGAAASLIRPDCPCRFEAQRALVRLDRPSAAVQGPIVVYPIDRTRTTPLTTLLPIDVLRNTLGVGPCQYILESEGLAGETNPTPDEVMAWVEKELKRKKRAANEDFRQRLEQMATHVGRMQTRIDKYAAFAVETRKLLAEAMRPDASAGAEPNTTLGPIVDGIEGAIAAGSGKPQAAQRVAKFNAELLVLLERKGSEAEVARLATEIRRIGAEQERTLANCRMGVRWLRARSTGAIRARAEAMLQNK